MKATPSIVIGPRWLSFASVALFAVVVASALPAQSVPAAAPTTGLSGLEGYVTDSVHNVPLEKARVAIEGYGNAGSIAATLLAAEGARIIAVSDSTGGIHNAAGLDPAKVSAWKAERGEVTTT